MQGPRAGESAQAWLQVGWVPPGLRWASLLDRALSGLPWSSKLLVPSFGTKQPTATEGDVPDYLTKAHPQSSLPEDVRNLGDTAEVAGSSEN